MKNKKSDAKIYMIFIGVMVVLYYAGYLVGSGIAKLQRGGNYEETMEMLKNKIVTVAPFLYAVFAIVALIVVLVLYLSCRKMEERLKKNPDDDDLWDKLEEKLNTPMIIANTMSIIDAFFIGCLFYIVEFYDFAKNGGIQAVIVVIDIFLVILVLAAGILIPKGIVDIEKRLNPEKEGNVFDFRFDEVWLASCDEAQKMIAYKAAYHALKNTNVACSILWVLAATGIFLFKSGVFPLFCVCIIWLISNVSYMGMGAKLEKRR